MRENHLKILQYVTGIGIFFLVGLHLLLMHLAGGDPEDWTSVAGRAASASWLAAYILILIFGIYHGLHGVRGVILEFSLPDRAVKVLNYSLVFIGIAVFGYAVYIPVHAF
jgi:succinate dehydrogenase hydrophobic anchor subunit